MNVAFQGERGAYSEEAIRQFFGDRVTPFPCRQLEDIFQAVVAKQAEYAMLPVENSTAGSIYRAYDLLSDHDLCIWGEVILRVRHTLLAVPGSAMTDIQRVRSHPQALAQAEQYINKRGWRAEPSYDTAGSARDLADDPEPNVAVIASRLAGQRYGLQELDYGIEDSAHNYTRFFVLSLDHPPRAQRTKTSVVFTTRHQPGALYECLGEFARRNLNFTKLESRPRPNHPWQYMFYLDFEGHSQDPPVEAAMMGLLRTSSFVKFLGSYPAATTPVAELDANSSESNGGP